MYAFFHFVDSFTFVSEISGYYSGEYKECCYLGCDTAWTETSVLTFQRNLLPPSPQLI